MAADNKSKTKKAVLWRSGAALKIKSSIFSILTQSLFYQNISKYEQINTVRSSLILEISLLRGQTWYWHVESEEIVDGASR